LGAIGLALPPRRITVNLAPADLLKEGSPTIAKPGMPLAICTCTSTGSTSMPWKVTVLTRATIATMLPFGPNRERS